MANKNFPHPFGDMVKKYAAFRRKLSIEVSNIAVNEFKHNFVIGGFRGDSGVEFWKPRKERKKSTRAILVKSGRLKRGLRAAPTLNMARVINSVPYALIHKEGGTIKKTVSVRSFLRKTKKGKKTTVKPYSRRMNLTLPARPFMITTKPLLNMIESHVFKELDNLLK
jgi:phage gpG-like protein